MKFAVVFITASSSRQAEKIAAILISKRLAACVNIIKGVSSIFIWHSKQEKAGEILLVAKTKITKFNQIEKEVKKIHSYEVPEIIALPIVCGNKKYLQWINDSVK